jgi:two-component system, NtrC family, sensor histidine kinase KinB
MTDFLDGDSSLLRRVDESQNDLVATVAHELRTPLTSLGMVLQLCLEQVLGPLTEKQAQALHAARQDCTRLQTMVDGLLDLSRTEGGCVEMHQQPIAIAALVQAALERHQTLAAKRGIQLATALPLSDGEVLVDAEGIMSVFSNLITNALRHTPSGGQITVGARSLDGWMRCEVTDTGEGIPQKFHRRIFAKHFRVPGAPRGGAGLGLAIARKVVQGHGGEMSVESAEGHGSRFWFTVPLVAAANAMNVTP